MSEIPFVNQLGDALETAIRRQPAHRRLRLGRRRYLAVALAALAVAGGGAAVAGMLNDPVEIGFGAVGCFEKTEADGNVGVISDPTRSPVDLCLSTMKDTYAGMSPRDLLACSWDGHGVVVVLREDRGSCSARGLAPLPPSYSRARRRAGRLQELVQRFERSVDCLPPREFARRLTVRLRRGGWRGWRAVPGDGGEGPCGRVSSASGVALIGTIGDAVDARRRTVSGRRAFPLGLERFVYDAGSPGVRLFDGSAERCYTVAGLQDHVREVFSPTGHPVRFTVRSLAPNVGIASLQGDLYEKGCAVYSGAYIAHRDGELEIVAELTQRDAPQP